MSGIEVAGLCLSILPVVVEVVNWHSERCRRPKFNGLPVEVPFLAKTDALTAPLKPLRHGQSFVFDPGLKALGRAKASWAPEWEPLGRCRFAFTFSAAWKFGVRSLESFISFDGMIGSCLFGNQAFGFCL